MLVALDGTSSKSSTFGVKRPRPVPTYTAKLHNSTREAYAVEEYRHSAFSEQEQDNQLLSKGHHITSKTGSASNLHTYVHVHTSTCTIQPSIEHVAFSPKNLFTDGKSLSNTDRGQGFPTNQSGVYTHYP